MIGYLYEPNGPGRGDVVALLPKKKKKKKKKKKEEVAHFAPFPDPAARWRGMSWLTPIIREVMGDQAATTHKLKFFEQGATPNMVVSLDKDIKQEAFERWVKLMEGKTAWLPLTRIARCSLALATRKAGEVERGVQQIRRRIAPANRTVSCFATATALLNAIDMGVVPGIALAPYRSTLPGGYAKFTGTTFAAISPCRARKSYLHIAVLHTL